MRAEKLLKAAGLAVRLVPTPRELSSDCGLALRFDDWQRADEVARVLAAAKVEVEQIACLTA